MHPALAAHFATSDVLIRQSDPAMIGIIDYALRLREIEAVLPGVYAQTGHRAFTGVRIAALRAYEPKAVLLAHSAARHSFWPSLPATTVTAAVPRRLSQQPGFRFIRRTVPPDLVTELNGTRLVTPALAALEAGADVVDHGLREKAFTLQQLAEAYEATRQWRGLANRRRLVEESSDNPWSAAERQFHRMLRAGGITGWRGNHPVGDHPVDVAFPAERLAIEIDGKHFHGDATFEKDRWQQNALVLAGWRVLRFTWTMIDNYPERVIGTVRKVLALSQKSPTATADRAAPRP